MQNPKKENASKSNSKKPYVPTEQEIQETLFRKQNVVQRWKNSPSKRAFVFFKMPYRATTIDNLVNSTKEIKSNYVACNSVICPNCSSGIMMRDSQINPQFQGNVEWFCSNNSNCDFIVYALPTFIDLKIRIKEPAYDIGQMRLKAMSNIDRNELINEHMAKARMFLFASVFFFVVFFWNILFQRWILCIQFLIITLVAFAFAVKWAYRAWQIKSGNVFLKHSPFVGWFVHAPKWFSLKWYDNDSAAAQKLNDEVLEIQNKKLNEK